jgi:hypothetical protein
MRFVAIAFIAFALASCKETPGLSVADQEYVHVSVDLIRSRSVAPPVDSAQIQVRLDSLYRRNHTSAAAYRAASQRLADDPAHAQKVFEAIRDSLKTVRH